MRSLRGKSGCGRRMCGTASRESATLAAQTVDLVFESDARARVRPVDLSARADDSRLDPTEIGAREPAAREDCRRNRGPRPAAVPPAGVSAACSFASAGPHRGAQRATRRRHDRTADTSDIERQEDKVMVM